MITIHKTDIKDFEGLFSKIDFNRDSLIEKRNFYISQDENFYDVSDYCKNSDREIKELIAEVKAIDWEVGIFLEERFNDGSLKCREHELRRAIRSYWNWGKRLSMIFRLLY